MPTRLDVAPELPPVMADRDALATALVNLLDNALKYTPGDKRIGVRACPQTATGIVPFVVTDNGIGIPAREQRRIFRRFYRVDQRLSRETGGVGLGLSIVELIVRGHRGSVTVRSAPGAGSTFTLRVSRAHAGGRHERGACAADRGRARTGARPLRYVARARFRGGPSRPTVSAGSTPRSSGRAI